MYLFFLNRSPADCRLNISLQLNSPVRVSSLIFFCMVLCFVLSYPSPGYSADGTTNIITNIETAYDNNSLKIRLQGSSVPIYTAYELFSPARLIVDLADSKLGAGVSMVMPDESGIVLSSKTINSITPFITRFIFSFDESRPFSVLKQDNDLLITIDYPSRQKMIATAQDMVVEITEVQVISSPQKTVVRLLADGQITSYRYSVLGKQGDVPPRLYIDVDNAIGDNLLKKQEVGSTALAAIRMAKRGSGMRFVLDAAGDELFAFQVISDVSGLKITIQESAPVMGGQEDTIASLILGKKSLIDQLPEIDPLQPIPQAVDINIAGFRQDAFAFGGYQKERITVDFFKIDLHNVFRLFREISGKNIVVDEAVSGSLTLALNDVPWDFALDIILNLKGLQKEERFNTIVILPGGQEFFWPERAEENLAFEVDLEVVAREALLIQQQEAIPPAVVEAKELINKGRELEKRKKFAQAVQVFEEALRKWPENARLAGRISSIYLVQLRHNTRALFFARKVLAIEPESSIGLLNSAIASANMQDFVQAKQYFDKAVMIRNPTKEALLNYAVFSEEQQYYVQALKLLRKHNSLYGEDLQSMLAMARILDKQGQEEAAAVAYKRILLSGYRITLDLRNFIQERIR